jgi:peptide/nickel transport system substrate-binding protein
MPMIRRPDVRRAAAAALILAALTAIAACRSSDPARSEPASTTPQRGGVAVLGSISDVDSWNEYVSRQSFANYLLRRMYLRLARPGADPNAGTSSYVPSLAESWETSPDGLAITFRLREAAWSDGRPVTAEDVRFTWEAQTSDGVAWVNRKLKERITDVEVLDPRTVVFRFVRSYPDQLADAVDGGILPQHVFEQVPFEQWNSHDWSTVRVGSGPFLLAEHRPGQDIVMARNPRYWRQDGPMLDRVVVRIVPDVINLMTQLRTGEIDFVMNVPPRDAERLASGTRDAVGIVPFKLPRYEYLGWNCDRPPFDDPLMRRAITLAIDREALVESLVFGYGVVGSRPVPSSWWGAAEGIEPWPYDPDEARRILAARGYATVDADGAKRGDGPTLTIDLITNAGNKLRENTLVKIHSQLAQVGVEVNLRTMEQRALIQKVQGGDFDGYLGGWNFEGSIPLDTLFGSAAQPPHGFNVVRYESATVDAKLERLGLASDREQMRPLLEEIQRRIHEDQPYTFLYERDGIAAYGPRLRGVRIDVPSDPLASLESFWVESTG